MGDLEFDDESFELSADPGLVMPAFTVEPVSPTAEAMRLLAAWSAPTPREPAITEGLRGSRG